MALFCPDSLVWGDVATWIAGIGTIGAVFTALYLPRIDERRKKAQRASNALVFAVAIKPELNLLAQTVSSIRSLLFAGERIHPEAISRALTYVQLPVINVAFDKVWLFDAETAALIAGAHGSLLQFGNVVRAVKDQIFDRSQQSNEMLIFLLADLQRLLNGSYEALLNLTGTVEEDALPDRTKLRDVEVAWIQWVKNGSNEATKPELPPELRSSSAKPN